MTVKEHYENHLGNFYSWMTGGFTEKQREQENFFRSNGIHPFSIKIAIDLGAGHGLQSVSLAHLGFSVKAVDFNKQLIQELHQNGKDLPIEIIEEDIIPYMSATSVNAELIVCMGDTLTHLKDLNQIDILLKKINKHLIPEGKVVLSFRDLTFELKDEDRFIPVKSDDNRTLTCFLEYFPDHVMVHDILHERENDKWVQKVSAYPKLRVNEKMIVSLLEKNGFKIVSTQVINRMIHLIGQRVLV